MQSKYGWKLITFKTRHKFDDIRIRHLGKEICEIEFTENETVERIVKKIHASTRLLTDKPHGLKEYNLTRKKLR